MTPTVLWWNKERGTWACCNMLNEMFDLYGCEHVTRYDRRPSDGAIVVLHGGQLQMFNNGASACEMINTAVSKMSWCIFVSIGDEGTEFPLHLLSHPNSRLWVQTPLPTTKADRYLIEGYPHGTRRVESRRDMNFFFSGQNTHLRRDRCMTALCEYWLHNGNGVYMQTDGFGKGMPQEEYLRFMSGAKIVPCPSGPLTPDTFRIWEALECGAVPIVDSRSLRDETQGFWPVVLGEHPFPMIDEWHNLPEVMGHVLGDWDRLSRFCQYWWKSYKLQFRDSLSKDLVALGAIAYERQEKESTQSA